MGKSSGPSEQESTVYQNSLPEYAEPYFSRLMDRAESESLRAYQPYDGQRLAETAPETWLARDMVMGMQGIPGLEGAYDATMTAMDSAEQLQNFQTGTYNPYQGSMYGYNDPSQWTGQMASDYVDPALANFEAPDANRFDYTNVNRFTPGAANYYMSPYMQNVVDVQKDRAELDFQRAQAGRDATAVQRGAYGGSRSAVVDALAQEDLARRMDEIQATGQQSAYEDAQRMFGADRQAIMAREAERAAENARIDDYNRMGAGLMADTRLGAYGLAGDLYGADRAALMDIDSARAAELARYDALMQGESQFAGDLDFQREKLLADLLSQGSQLSSQFGQDLLSLGAAERQAILEDAQLREQIGADIEGTRQEMLDLGYEDYLRQIYYPQDQLSFYSSILQGMPVSPDTTQTLYQQRNPYQDALGAGISALGLYQGLQ